MIDKLANILVQKMEDNNIIIKEECQIYNYVITIYIESFLAIGTLLIIGIILKNFIYTLFFSVFFFSLRKRTGGFHFPKFYQCYVATIITYIVMQIIISKLVCNILVIFIYMLIAVVVINIIGTINHPNINMNSEELKNSKESARFLCNMEMFIVCILICMKINTYLVSYLASAIILCAILLVFGKIFKQEVIIDER